MQAGKAFNMKENSECCAARPPSLGHMAFACVHALEAADFLHGHTQ